MAVKTRLSCSIKPKGHVDLINWGPDRPNLNPKSNLFDFQNKLSFIQKNKGAGIEKLLFVEIKISAKLSEI